MPQGPDRVLEPRKQEQRLEVAVESHGARKVQDERERGLFEVLFFEEEAKPLPQNRRTILRR